MSLESIIQNIPVTHDISTIKLNITTYDIIVSQPYQNYFKILEFVNTTTKFLKSVSSFYDESFIIYQDDEEQTITKIFQVANVNVKKLIPFIRNITDHSMISPNTVIGHDMLTFVTDKLINKVKLCSIRFENKKTFIYKPENNDITYKLITFFENIYSSLQQDFIINLQIPAACGNTKIFVMPFMRNIFALTGFNPPKCAYSKEGWCIKVQRCSTWRVPDITKRGVDGAVRRLITGDDDVAA